MRSSLHSVAVLCSIASLAVSAAAEDLTLKFQVTNGKQTSTSTDYLTAEKMRSGDGEQDTIVDFAAGTITNLNHKRKEYSRISVDELEALMESMNAQMAEASADMDEAMKNMPAAMRERMAGMLGGGASSVTVTKGGTREVAGYPTQQYTIAMGEGMQIEQWVTTKLDLPMAPGAFARMARFTNPLMNNPMLKGIGQMAEKMKEIEGYTLAQKTRISMMGRKMESSREAVEVTPGPIPASTFEVPGGYKKVASPFEQMAGKK